MRIYVNHETQYRYETPVSGVIQILRLTPRNHDGQHVIDWRIDVSADCRLDRQQDAFGNIVHAFTAAGPLSDLTIGVTGEVETNDTGGVVRGAVERFPPSLYLRETPLTQPDDAIKEFASRAKTQDGVLALLHDLLMRINTQIAFDTDPTHVSTTAAEAFSLKRGVCQDMSHIFISCARFMGVPARYVSGYLCQTDGRVHHEAGHAWAETYVNDLGWIAFDPTNGICATDAYVRVAVGLDYLGAAPVRGTRYGGGSEALAVRVAIDQSVVQVQN
jgi:transglutaminase-like putative cysteine protease